MICIKCNHKLPDDSEFCQYCGSKIDVEDILNGEESVFEQTEIINKPTFEYEEVKIRFCKLCGNQIDNKTKKCIGCGKQYFKGIKLNKSSVTVMILSFVILISVILNIYFLNSNNYYKDKNLEYQTEIESLKSTKNKYATSLYFYEKHVALIDYKSKKYHKYSCDDFDRSSSSKWLYACQEAEQRGYYPCPKCH